MSPKFVTNLMLHSRAVGRSWRNGWMNTRSSYLWCCLLWLELRWVEHEVGSVMTNPKPFHGDGNCSCENHVQCESWNGSWSACLSDGCTSVSTSERWNLQAFYGYIVSLCFTVSLSILQSHHPLQHHLFCMMQDYTLKSYIYMTQISWRRNSRKFCVWDGLQRYAIQQ